MPSTEDSIQADEQTKRQEHLYGDGCSVTYGAVLSGVVLSGVVWYGVVWCGVVWNSVVQCVRLCTCWIGVGVVSG